MITNMKVGQRYRIVTRQYHHKLKRESICDFLGERSNGQVHNIVVSYRPLAGTTEIPLSWILSVEKVAKSTPIKVQQVIRS